MGWFHWLRIRLLPVTRAEAQKRVDTLDRSLSDLRAKVAALPADERAAHSQTVQAMIAEHAHARNVLSDTLDDRSER
jgi:hypothetical protein